MSGRAGSIAVLNDVRALLATFLSHGWQSAVVRVGDSEFLLSHDALLEQALSLVAASESPAAVPLAAPVQLQTVSAPHVATLVEIAAVGSIVAKGGQVVVLSVLGERVEISASASGQVKGHKAQPGALVEYGQVLVELTA